MQKHEVLYYVYYSAYDPFVHTDGYDYALLVLTEKIIFDTYRSSIPVCTGEQGRSNPNNYTVMVVGLGKIEGGKRPKAWMVSDSNTKILPLFSRRSSRRSVSQCKSWYDR